MMSKIEILNIKKVLRRNTVLDDITLTLESPKVVGFKGINGSGKTMLMRLICGLISPTEGKVIIDGEELGKDISFPPDIGLLLENPAFIDDYSAFDNLKLLGGIRGKADEKKIQDAICRVGLNEAGKKKYKKFSLGMKQRLGIAAAIMESPDIIVLDEPTNSLDDEGVELVKNIVTAEKARGALVIVSCHDKNILEFLSDEIYTITQGKITEHVILNKE